MSTSKWIDRICCIAAAAALMLSCLLLGVPVRARAMGYESRLFDTDRVHTIDIVIDDWDAFLQTAQSEEYTLCNVVIDGEVFKNVGIRGKGNTSLSTVSTMDSDRYSFKIEFDQYDSSKSYYGLDKLSLNNLIQDNTMMKDHLVYQMMNEFGAAAPLSSYVYITVNGEDWGLYLAVEAVEESFLQRNYGSNYGDLYKPDSLNMGGGRGNGKDFSPEDFAAASDGEDASGSTMPDISKGFDPSQMSDMMPEESGSREQSGQAPSVGNAGSAQTGGMRPGEMGGSSLSFDEGALRTAFEELSLDTALLDGIDFENITMETIQAVISSLDEDTMQKLVEKLTGAGSVDRSGNLGGTGMGSEETRLQYIDDDPDSYSTILSSAKTDVTHADQTRLIAALKELSEGRDSAVNTEAVIRYFVVHNFVVNGDSYTGSMIHNYYLYEEDGQLSMIPWDYNLAFGTFQGSSADSAANDDIDAPLSVTGTDRPMIDWIFRSEEYTELYHRYFREFLDTVDVQSIIADTRALIAPYVEKDPTKFCTFEEFEAGVETLSAFCGLRCQSVQQQLSGGEGNVDASAITLSDMGTMDHGFGGGRGEMPSMPGAAAGSTTDGAQQRSGFGGQGGMALSEGTETPEGMQKVFSDSFSGRGYSGTDAPQEGSQWLLLLVSAVFLAAGLLLAFKFK